MDTKQKYVRLERYNEFIIFPCILKHSTFRHLNPISAGFCYVNADKKRVDCFGKSYSLNLKSDTENDTLYATKQIFGIDSFLDIQGLNGI
jgi:hypothetical protein